MKLPNVSLSWKFKRFLKLNIKDKVFVFFEYLYSWMQNRMNFRWKYFMEINNMNNYENLLIIVAWYQEYLYDKVLTRVNNNIEDNVDVCIVTPWKKDVELMEYCKNFWWSYLYTKENKLSLAQNVAIKLHTKAKFIYKMDKDIFITKWFFTNLKEKYYLAVKNSEYIPGAITPVININAFSYSFFLDIIWKKQEYSNKYWAIKQDCNNIGTLWEIAKYIRNNTLPIDSTQEKFFKSINIREKYITNSVRYSIGCFMFPRDVWEDMWWFDVAFEWWLGKEEKQFLSYSINESRPIILCENSLCWHFSFWSQKLDMKEFFEKNKNLF